MSKVSKKTKWVIIPGFVLLPERRKLLTEQERAHYRELGVKV